MIDCVFDIRSYASYFILKVTLLIDLLRSWTLTIKAPKKEKKKIKLYATGWSSSLHQYQKVKDVQIEWNSAKTVSSNIWTQRNNI